MRATFHHQFLLVLICAVLYLPNLGVPHLWDDDEAYFAQAAWEMLNRGDLIVPYFNREVFVHKPPVMYWAMIAAFRIFGETEFAARLPAVLFGAGNVLLTFHLGRFLFGTRVGIWSALVLASSLNYVVVARSATTDMELIFFCTLPIVIVLARMRSMSPPNAGDGPWSPTLLRGAWPLPWHTWALSYAAMGLALLTKGPVGIVLPTAVLGLFLLLLSSDERVCARIDESPDAKRVRCNRIASAWAWLRRTFAPCALVGTAWQMRPLTALAMIAIVAAPWYAAVGVLTDGVWVEEFFGVHNFGRALSAVEGHRGGPWYYLIAICIGTFPWCIFLGQSLRQLGRCLREGHPARPAGLLLIAWFSVWVGAFTMVRTKLPHYVLPAYPAVAIGLGMFLDGWVRETVSVNRRWIRGAWLTLAAVGVCMLIVLPLVTNRFLPQQSQLALIGLIPLVGGVSGFFANERGHRRLAAAALVGVAMGFSPAILAYGAVCVDRYQNSHVVAGWLRDLSPDSESPVGTYDYFRPSLVYYSKQRVESLGDPADVRRFFDERGAHALLITTDEALGQLRSVLPEDVAILRQTRRFLEPEQILVLGRRSATESLAVQPRELR